jgi:hypothetical protein
MSLKRKRNGGEPLAAEKSLELLIIRLTRLCFISIQLCGPVLAANEAHSLLAGTNRSVNKVTGYGRKSWQKHGFLSSPLCPDYLTGTPASSPTDMDTGFISPAVKQVGGEADHLSSSRWS